MIKARELHLRKMLRHQAFYGQDSLKLEYKKPRIKKARLFLLCDVSGSMKRYSRFLIPFMFALRQPLSHLDVAVFSTHMTMITDKLCRQRVDAALADIANIVADWDGGTNLGQSFQQLNTHLQQHLSDEDTILIVLMLGKFGTGMMEKVADNLGTKFVVSLKEQLENG